MKRPNGDGWIVCLGRLRFAWVSPSEWVEKKFPIKYWFFISKLYARFDPWLPSIITRKYWQVTILGFQIAFLYRGDWRKVI